MRCTVSCTDSQDIQKCLNHSWVVHLLKCSYLNDMHDFHLKQIINQSVSPKHVRWWLTESYLMLDNSKQHPWEAQHHNVCFFYFIGSRAVGADVVRAQIFLRWHSAEISCSESPHQLTDMNIQHYFASLDRNPSQQLPSQSIFTILLWLGI